MRQITQSSLNELHYFIGRHSTIEAEAIALVDHQTQLALERLGYSADKPILVMTADYMNYALGLIIIEECVFLETFEVDIVKYHDDSTDTNLSSGIRGTSMLLSTSLSGWAAWSVEDVMNHFKPILE